MREERTEHRRSCRNNRVVRGLVAVFVSCLTTLVPSVASSIAFADSPAVTDFGQDFTSTALAGHHHDSRALFLTLYPDGREQMEVRVIHGDAVAGFVAEHPGWRLDTGLMWFVQMPVYIRDLSIDVPKDSADSV